MDLGVVGLFESKSLDSLSFRKGVKHLGATGMLCMEITFVYRRDALLKLPSSKASAMRNIEGNVTSRSPKEYLPEWRT